jgi:hypothetical protein
MSSRSDGRITDKWAEELARVQSTRATEGWGQTQEHLRELAKGIILKAIAEARSSDACQELTRLTEEMGLYEWQQERSGSQ